MTITDPLLQWHEALVVAGFEVEDFTMEPHGWFAVFGTLDRCRLALWRNFRHSINIVVESAAAPHSPLVHTSRKAPSGGSVTQAWFRVQWCDSTWRWSPVDDHPREFIGLLSAIRAVTKGDVRPVDMTEDALRRYWGDRWVNTAIGPKDIPPSWLNAARTPESPRRP
jgi:hypothetical protein